MAHNAGPLPPGHGPQHAKTVPCGNAVHKRQCFSICGGRSRAATCCSLASSSCWCCCRCCCTWGCPSWTRGSCAPTLGRRSVASGGVSTFHCRLTAALICLWLVFQLSAGVSEELHQMLPQPCRRRCGRCLLQQPMRSRHCQTCRHCVRRFDHHCPWIENCVGERNHRWFVLYLAVQLLVLLWGLRAACSGFVQAPAWGQWLEQNSLLMLASSATGIFSVVVVLLLGSHLYLISLNTTTWEFMSRHRISYLKHCGDENPFDRGILRNLWEFFCVRRVIAWEEAYAKISASPA
ncbi:palmitoyltransferase ZDHHC12-A isoform X2 [Paramormyrops kingsleyae]|uniref:palmitoyltransferase ZDHHC12-A isoform X2 n=1 Tax=Paramormyrops kingsleyae TaxID=1676925 RepID=UPI003B97C5B5